MSEFVTSRITLPDDFAEEEHLLPPPAQYALALVFVVLATVLGIVAEHLIRTPSISLIFVLPVVLSATAFGWGPSMAASIASVLAFDFFFTDPRFSFAIASPADISEAALLLVIAAIVSTVAAQSRRQALSARRAAEQAQALQAMAHVVIEARPDEEIAQAAATALNRIFHAPAVVFGAREGGLELVARAGAVRVASADQEAAGVAAGSRAPTRSETYPVPAARFDFWPVTTPAGVAYVLGVDFRKFEGGRPRDPQRLIEVVGAYLAASPAAKNAAGA